MPPRTKTPTATAAAGFPFAHLSLGEIDELARLKVRIADGGWTSADWRRIQELLPRARAAAEAGR